MRLLLLFLAVAACGSSSDVSGADREGTGGEAPVADAPVSPDTPFGLMNGAVSSEGLYTAGQPSGASIEAAHGGGVRTVISLRAEDEPGQEAEAEAVERLGIRFERLVIQGAGDVTPDNARRLDELLGEASNHGETLVHCGSSNRAGALIALRAFFVLDATLGDSIEHGRAAGLVSLEGRVREVLEQACADAPDDARCPRESTP